MNPYSDCPQSLFDCCATQPFHHASRYMEYVACGTLMHRLFRSFNATTYSDFWNTLME